MPGAGIGVSGVLLSAVGSDADDLRSADWSTSASGRLSVDELRFGGLTVQVDRYRLTVQCPPGLDVGPVDGDSSTCEQVPRNGRTGELVGEPLSINFGNPGFQDPTQFCEEAFDPRICLVRIPLPYLEADALVIGQGVDDPSHLDEMCLVVSRESVELAPDQKSEEAQLARASHFSVHDWPERLKDSRTFNNAAGQAQFGSAGLAPPGCI